MSKQEALVGGWSFPPPSTDMVTYFGPSWVQPSLVKLADTELERLVAAVALCVRGDLAALKSELRAILGSTDISSCRRGREVDACGATRTQSGSMDHTSTDSDSESSLYDEMARECLAALRRKKKRTSSSGR